MKSILCLFIALISYFSSYSQWVQTNGPNGGYTNEIVQVGSELIASVGNGGIYKSYDGGNTWRLSISGMPCNPSIQALAQHNGRVYASVSANGIYVSDDRGNSWTALNSSLANLTFYSLFFDGSDIYGGSSNGPVYYSPDAGMSWSNKSTGITNDPLFKNHISAFIKYNSIVYAAGTFLYQTTTNGDTWEKVAIPNLNANGLRDLIIHDNIFYGSSDGVVHASSDGLNTWNTQLVTSNHATITGLFSNNNILYGTTSQGRYFYTNNNGAQWIPVENTATQSLVRHLFFINGSILMSTSEGFYKSVNNGATWALNNDGISALQIESLASNNSYIFAGTTNNGIFRSSDNGNNWIRINNGLNNIKSLRVSEISTNGNSIVIATDDGIYQSSNHGSSWVKRFDPGINRSTQGLDYNNGTFVTAVNGVGVYLSSDNGQNWNLVSTNGLDIDTSYYSVKMNGNVIVVSTHNGGMYISKNLGNTWQNISITSSFHITHEFEFINNKLYAATTKGLMISSDLGQNWSAFNNDARYINDILFDEDKIYISTDFGNYVANHNEKVWYDLCEGMGKQFTNKLLIHNDILFAGSQVTSVWRRNKATGNLPPSEDSSTIGIEKLSLCAISGPVNLYIESGISPSSNGYWTPNLSGANGIFDPLIDPPGIYTFTFNNDYCGCANYIRIEVSLDGQANAGVDTVTTICKDKGVLNLLDILNGTPNSGGSWSPPLTSGTDIFDPSIDAEGIYTYTISNLQCGTDSSKIDISLINSPNAGTDAVLSICENEPEFNLLNHLGDSPDLGGIWSPSLSSGTNQFNPSTDPSGIYTYTVTNGSCSSSSAIEIKVTKKTNAGMDGVLEICIASDPVNLIDFLKGNPDTNGTWSPALHDGDGVFNPSKDLAGIYTYTTNSSCGSQTSNLAVSIIENTEITHYDIDVLEFASNNSIHIKVDSGLQYEYSLDGRLFQVDPIFDRLRGGRYMVSGREIDGCGFFVEEVFILDYPKYFTPNNDTWNDVWKINGVSNEKFQAYIYDRFGKILKHFQATTDTWDGTYNGKPMPAADYWFRLVFEDGMEKIGHFSLIR